MTMQWRGPLPVQSTSHVGSIDLSCDLTLDIGEGICQGIPSFLVANLLHVAPRKTRFFPFGQQRWT